MKHGGRWGAACREDLDLGKDITIDSAEKPQECFDELSMNGNHFKDFDYSSVRPEALKDERRVFQQNISLGNKYSSPAPSKLTKIISRRKFSVAET